AKTLAARCKAAIVGRGSCMWSDLSFRVARRNAALTEVEFRQHTSRTKNVQILTSAPCHGLISAGTKRGEAAFATRPPLFHPPRPILVFCLRRASRIAVPVRFVMGVETMAGPAPRRIAA